MNFEYSFFLILQFLAITTAKNLDPDNHQIDAKIKDDVLNPIRESYQMKEGEGEFEESKASNGIGKTFLYFGYGSNLLTKRIQYKNKSAVRKSIGQLKDWRLDFAGSSNYWGGASATIVPQPGGSVWGALWEIDMENLSYLDEQEGVNANIYFPKTVDIHLKDGQIVPCRIYERTKGPAPGSTYPYELPSLLYLNTIIQGAIESNLPEDYVEHLKNTPHNSNFDEELAALFGVEK